MTNLKSVRLEYEKKKSWLENLQVNNPQLHSTLHNLHSPTSGKLFLNIIVYKQKFCIALYLLS